MPDPPESVKAFAAETGVNGLNIFQSRRDWLDTIFWLGFVIIFSCYTIYSLVPVCESYINEDVTTLVRQQRNDSFSFPAPSLCVYITDGMVNTSRDLSVDDAIAEYVTTGDLKASSFPVAFKALSDLAAHSCGPFIAALHGEDTAPFVNVSAILASFGRQRRARLNVLNIFADFVLRKFCRGLNISIWHARGNTVTLPACLLHQIDFESRHGEDGICIDFSPADFVFRGSVDHVRIKFNTTEIRERLGFDVKYAWFLIESSGQEGSSRDFDSQFQIVPRDRRTHYVRINTLYKNLDLHRRHCDEDRTRSLFCVDRCELAAFNQSYKCWPFIKRDVQNDQYQLDKRVRRCGPEDYSNFSSVVDASIVEEFRRCQEACLPACSNPVFSIIGQATEGESKRTVAGISVISYVYPLVEEHLANDFETFLAAFGGGLGLWLGISFASLVHIPYFWFRVLIAWLCKRSRSPLKQTKNGLEREDAAEEREMLNAYP